MLRNNYMFFATLTPWYYWSNEPGSEFSTNECRVLLKLLPFLQGIGGHTVRNYLDYENYIERPVLYFTFVRDPVDRYVSHYRYQKQIMGIDWEFDDFLAEPRFNDLMTRRLAGAADVGEAKRQLESKFCFVGLTERFDESILILRQALAGAVFDPHYEKRNEIPLTSEMQEISAKEDRIRANNALDIALYRYVQEVLYPRQLAAYDGDLDHDMRSFGVENEQFKFSRARMCATALLKKLVYRPLEFMAKSRWH